jgi:hypothetical protein
MDQRYETAREFFRALEEYNARQPIAPTTRQPVVESAPPPPQPEAPKLGARERQTGSEREARDQRNSVMVGRDHARNRALASGRVPPPRAITVGGQAPVLEDLQSANGTYVNNNRVERVVLKPGDIDALRRGPHLRVTCYRIIDGVSKSQSRKVSKSVVGAVFETLRL